MSTLPTPHFDKLNALIANEKLPEGDKARLEKTASGYREWIAALDAVTGSPDERISKMVELLNSYRLAVDIDLIFDSEDDFLYRQKGQLKLDNSVIEEFLPRLIQPGTVPETKGAEIIIGSATSFLSVFFTSSMTEPSVGGGLNVRSKDQDFVIAKKLYIQTSYSPTFEKERSEVHQTCLAYVAAECKTNLDKTMFQEACATARDTKLAVPAARYYLLCEWLDMTPMSTATTDIDEVLILRMAKRINSNVRQKFSTTAGRKNARADYLSFLKAHPLRREIFARFVEHVRSLLNDKPPEEKEVLKHGFF